MKRIGWMILMGSLALNSAPLRVTAVLRQGLPPFEENDARLYRLEGEGCGTLRVGELLVLRRDGEKRGLGRLKVTEIRAEHVLSILQERGETYPLKGDHVIRVALCDGLPDLPCVEPQKELQAVGALQPKKVTEGIPTARPTPESKPIVSSMGSQRQSIFFLKGDASLSPGAFSKLKTAFELWGAQGQWVLACPSDASTPPTLLQDRLAALKSELVRLGVQQLDVQPLPSEAPARYDVIYVIHESR